jgi:hypothetical protein
MFRSYWPWQGRQQLFAAAVGIAREVRVELVVEPDRGAQAAFADRPHHLLDLLECTMPVDPRFDFDSESATDSRDAGPLPWFYSFLVTMSYCFIVLGTLAIWAGFFVAVRSIIPDADGRQAIPRASAIIYLMLTLTWACFGQICLLIFPSLFLLFVDFGLSLRRLCRRR